MKRLILLLLFPLLVQAQEIQAEKSHFIALYTVGSNWDMGKAPNEQLYFKEHSAFLSGLREAKTIVLGARYGDTGMIVFKASDLESAIKMLHQDVALQRELFTVVVHPYLVQRLY